MLYVNAAAEELLGQSRARVSFAPLTALPRFGPALDRLCARAQAELATSRGELEAGRARASVAPWFLSERLRGFTITIAEPSDRIDLAALAAGLAHEIRNPLAGLRGAGELLREELPQGSPLDDYAALIVRESERLDRLVGSLLDLTRPLVVHPQEENLHERIDEVLVLLRGALPRGIVIERRFDPSIPRVPLARDPITQVLLNLLQNAIEAHGGGPGRVIIETGVVAGMRVLARGERRSLARIAVLDEGEGLPESIELFTPFSSTKPKGAGLGLVLSRRIVEAHGGRLSLRNRRDGRGVEAEVLLPL